MEPSAKYCDKGEMLLRECIKSARYLQRQKTATLETKTRSHRWKTEIPNFLTEEECQHIMQKAKETGLELSEVALPEEQDKFASSCYDDDYRCVRWAKYGECEKNPGYMLKNCQQSCEVCEDGRVLDFDDLDRDEDGLLCDDNEADCSKYAQDGECENFPVWMLLTCRKACGNCGCEDLAANCSSLEKEGKCLHPDHANWMLRNCRRTCKVCLGAVSYDTYRKMDANDLFKFVKTMARKHPRHRSRYSHTAWLHSTTPDPIQNKIIDRFVTILYYLNDVEEGGETAFIVADNSTLNQSILLAKRGQQGDPYNLSNYCQDASLVIAPKRGTAVMWYNHYLDSDSEWLGDRDPYSLHGGCDVRRGHKWIANHWIPAPYENYQHIPITILVMNLTRTSFFMVLFNFFKLPKLEGTTVKNKMFKEPCFEEDQDLTQYSFFDESFDKDGRNSFKLVHLQGKRTGHVQWLELEEGRSYKLITRAMRPLLFEIPHFLTDDECEHVISLAKEAGLSASQVAIKFDEKDLNEVLKQVDRNTTLDKEDYFARDLNVWDRNKDNVVDIEEIRKFAKMYKSLHLKQEEIVQMLESCGLAFDDNTEEKITTNYLSDGNVKKLLSYMSFLRTSSPQHKFRYSDQAWLRQDKTADHILRRLHERIAKLTKLPRKLLQGSESMQVVRYQTSGHYHAHFDSGMDPSVPCCHQNVDLRPPQCRLCRFVTILYYLNDVEQGGETAFPLADNSTITFKELPNPESDEFNLSISCQMANLVIPPKKGTAIMWYNNFIDPDSELLGDLDVNSIHGGCDVIKGEKWIANNWLTAPTKNSRHFKSAYDVGFD
ncbi:hypothetical protein pdam_00003641 [Pocillopora damicornis]|uniref:Procollagen-proline 4-dioxygenase n=2 Tax=Pocillopora damicornis TaxID=46731 RepID=A0A3M6V113_POCDA|nr:hypothetical protein pdam_00003641 [Pocillopora damicornis]